MTKSKIIQHFYFSFFTCNLDKEYTVAFYDDINDENLLAFYDMVVT